MREQDLITLVRATLLAELPPGVEVLQKNNPVAVGASSTPTIYIEVVVPALRVGWLGRQDRNTPTDNMTHEELQWLETTLQISALARLVDGQPSASDWAQTAADILQGDAGLASMGAQRVRPLRVTTNRTIYFVNDQDQYEANPSFDIVLSHAQVRTSSTPPVTSFEGEAAAAN